MYQSPRRLRTSPLSSGELALMYSCPRAATVRALTDCVVWALERRQ